jgi:hypothetical protein
VSRVTVIGAIVFGLGIVSTVVLFLDPTSPGYAPAMLRKGAGAVLWLALTAEAWFTVTGALLLARHRWGYRLAIPLLWTYVVLGFPLFTYFAYSAIRHLRRPDVRAEFGV